MMMIKQLETRVEKQHKQQIQPNNSNHCWALFPIFKNQMRKV